MKINFALDQFFISNQLFKRKFLSGVEAHLLVLLGEGRGVAVVGLANLLQDDALLHLQVGALSPAILE